MMRNQAADSGNKHPVNASTGGSGAGYIGGPLTQISAQTGFMYLFLRGVVLSACMQRAQCLELGYGRVQADARHGSLKIQPYHSGSTENHQSTVVEQARRPSARNGVGRGFNKPISLSSSEQLSRRVVSENIPGESVKSRCWVL